MVVEISLADRPAIVTSASRGIGRAIAEKFAAAGGSVVMCSRSLNRAGSDARKTWLDQYPLGRFGTPEEVADTALFLAFERAGFITGTDVTVDGEFTCGLPTSFVNDIYQADDPPRQ